MQDESPSPMRPTRGAPLDLPRLPVLGWATFTGPSRSPLPCILDRDDIAFTKSGRAAIARALRALRIGSGDRVLVPTFHCPTMIAPVVAVGAEPVYFPIDATGAAMVDAIEPARMEGVRAMLVAHYFGLPQPMGLIRRFCDRLGIALIEDCAHALFGVSDDRPVGSWGDFAIASLTKFLPVVDGGCLVPSARAAGIEAPHRPTISTQIRSLANTIELGARHGRLRGANIALRAIFAAATRLRRPTAAPPADEALDSHDDIAHRWLADFASGASIEFAPSAWTLWVARHAHRARIVALRRRNYQRLVDLIAGIDGVRALNPDLPEHAAPYVFPLWVDEPGRVYAAVRAYGIPVFRWDEVWPSRPTITGDHGAAWSTHVFQLGCHQDLGPGDLSQMIDALAAIIGGYRGCQRQRTGNPAKLDSREPASLGDP